MKTFGWIVAGFLGLVVLITLAFVLNIGGLEWNRFFGKYQSDVDDDVWREGTPYREHMNQRLGELRYQWNTDPDGRSGIEATVRHQYNSYNADEIYDDSLRNWLISIRNGTASQPTPAQ